MSARLRHTAARFGRFNLVGLAGFVVQIGLLQALTRWTAWPLAICVTIAVVVTVTHNFAWHVRYTWPGATDRWLARWLAFVGSNGLISLGTNLVVTTTLAGAGTPVLVANVVAVGAAAVVNFVVSDRLVFGR